MAKNCARRWSPSWKKRPKRRRQIANGSIISSYLRAFNVDLYLSANAETVSKALKSGIAAAVVYPESKAPGKEEDSIRIALDGDGLLFNSTGKKAKPHRSARIALLI